MVVFQNRSNRGRSNRGGVTNTNSVSVVEVLWQQTKVLWRQSTWVLSDFWVVSISQFSKILFHFRLELCSIEEAKYFFTIATKIIQQDHVVHQTYDICSGTGLVVTQPVMVWNYTVFRNKKVVLRNKSNKLNYIEVVCWKKRTAKDS